MKKWAELNPLQTIVPLIKGSKATDLLQLYTPRLQPLPSYNTSNYANQ